MNNTVENDFFFDFPRYSGYIGQGRWSICKIFVSNFLRISHAENR